MSHRYQRDPEYRQANKQGGTIHGMTMNEGYPGADPGIEQIGMGCELAGDEWGWMRFHATHYGARMARKYWRVR